MACSICGAPGMCVCPPSIRERRAPICDRSDSISSVGGEVVDEAIRASALWPPFSSAHEGYAVLLEEVDELKAHVWTNQKRRNLTEMRAEAIQVAAMALRFALDVCSEERGRK
jgi:hypothetical protein